MDGFRLALEDSFLSELDLYGGKFTWKKCRGKPDWVKERLDRAFGTSSWFNKFPLCKLTIHHTFRSDHDPIQVELVSILISKRLFRFKFENMWLKDPSFVKEIKDYWLKIPTMHLLPKLVNVSTYMAKWGLVFFNKFREKVKRQKEVIGSLVDRTDAVGVEMYMSEVEKLNDLLFQEESYWKQRAKIFWLEEGDANTRFFHASATSRKKANRISCLVTDSGVRTDEHEGMCLIVQQYYGDIFKASEYVQVEESEARFMISEDQNMDLVADVSFEEFTVALKQMHPDKASGPDGLNPAFFQQFWDCMGREVYECCKNWLSTCSFPADFNNTNLFLIPKKTNACNMKDFRPIALCNVLYKILAKVLANRLKMILPGLISENQSAFVPGRSITENVLIAFEVLHHMKRKRGRNEGEVALKLDISKAYDRVDWDYLRIRMKSMGFCWKWINWIMLCVTTVSYEVYFNDSSIGPIIPKRGLRQGDPLSPYLFLLCVEGLSDLLNEAGERGNIHGCQVSPTAPVITHLLFADDSFLFFKANKEETRAVKAVLNKYEQQSGNFL